MSTKKQWRSRAVFGIAAAALLGGFSLTCAAQPMREVPKLIGGSDKPVVGVTPGAEMAAIVPGRFIVDAPTLENLGFRWYVEGDSNCNAAVAVSYRAKGAAEWKEALPMLRVYHEISNQDYGPYRVGNLFAGSVLFLAPGAEYEVRFTMTDPDGGAPAEPKLVTVATRSEPKAPEGGAALHVYAPGAGGERLAPSFEDLAAAFAAANPGDAIMVHGGVHKVAETLKLTKSGTPEKPILFRGAGDGEAIIEGPGRGANILDIAGADNLMFEDLTFRQAKQVMAAGRRGEAGASGLVVRRCRMLEVVYGIETTSENSTNWHIADNEIVGINKTWYPRPSGSAYMSPAHTGVNVYGRGHVICHNRISRFSDSVAIANYGVPPADVEKQCVNIDVYNNDLSWAQDDTFEADYGSHNIRFYRNLCYNAHTAMSAQPFYGGPLYLIRNEVYGITALVYKLHNWPSGILAYNNTTCCARAGFQTAALWQNGHFRNNLMLGGADFVEEGGRVRKAYGIVNGSPTSYSTMDYDGFRRNSDGPLIRWSTDGGKTNRDYADLAAWTKATGLEEHGIMVDYDIFVKGAPPEAGKTHEPSDCDLRLVDGAVAVDAGIHLPNVTDGYAGKAPDLGCYELGSPIPHYGPRPR